MKGFIVLDFRCRLTKYLPPTPPTTPPELQESYTYTTPRVPMSSGELLLGQEPSDFGKNKSTTRTSVSLLETILTRKVSCSPSLNASDSAEATQNRLLVPGLLPQLDLHQKLGTCRSLAEYIQLVAGSYTAREAAESLKLRERSGFPGGQFQAEDARNTLNGMRSMGSDSLPRSAFHTPLSINTTDLVTREQVRFNSGHYAYDFSKVGLDLSLYGIYRPFVGPLHSKEASKSEVNVRRGNQNKQEESSEQKPTGFFRPWEKQGKSALNLIPCSCDQFHWCLKHRNVFHILSICC